MPGGKVGQSRYWVTVLRATWGTLSANQPSVTRDSGSRPSTARVARPGQEAGTPAPQPARPYRASLGRLPLAGASGLEVAAAVTTWLDQLAGREQFGAAADRLARQAAGAPELVVALLGFERARVQEPARPFACRLVQPSRPRCVTRRYRDARSTPAFCAAVACQPRLVASQSITPSLFTRVRIVACSCNAASSRWFGARPCSA
jgi:hypothetical protein